MVRTGLQSLTTIDTFYSRTATAEVPRPSLSGRLEVDVCIVGGGLAGLTTALELARRGRRVCVLEAECVAWGASGRNGGFVSPGYSQGYAQIERAAGTDTARTLHRLSIEGARAVADNIAALHLRDANRIDGILAVSRYEAADEFRARRDWLEREFDYPLEFRTTEQMYATLASPRYRQGLYNPHAFHIHPLNYARGLAREIERLGGSVLEGSPVRALDFTGAVRVAAGEQGEVHACDIVIACGGYTGGLVPELRRSFLPIATYVMLTEANESLIASAIRTRAAIADQRRAGDYYRLVDGGARILWGARSPRARASRGDSADCCTRAWWTPIRS